MEKLAASRTTGRGIKRDRDGLTGPCVLMHYQSTSLADSAAAWAQEQRQG